MIKSYSFFGSTGSMVNVEVDVRRGIPATDIVGISDAKVSDVRTLVRNAVEKAGFSYPSERVLISLYPCDLKKENNFSLPIALSILFPNLEEDFFVYGDFSSDSLSVRECSNVYNAVEAGISNGMTSFILPSSCVEEIADFAGKADFYLVSSLQEAVKAVRHEMKPAEIKALKYDCDEIDGICFPYCEKKEVTGDSKILRTLALVAGYGFHALLYGKSDTERSSMAYEVENFKPCLTENEAESVRRIHSIAGLKVKSMKSPFRLPHQTASIEGMCGGGCSCKPGEISLSHNGTLLLDEAAEFRSSVIQMLRVPLTTHSITLSRAGRTTVYPADFSLLMTMNTCPCGNYGSKNPCLCSANSIMQYWRKISSPLIARIHVVLPCMERKNEKVSLEELRKISAKARKNDLERGFCLRSATEIQLMNVYSTFDENARKIIESIESESERKTLIQLSKAICEMRDCKEVSSDDVHKAMELKVIPF